MTLSHICARNGAKNTGTELDLAANPHSLNYVSKSHTKLMEFPWTDVIEGLGENEVTYLKR